MAAASGTKANKFGVVDIFSGCGGLSLGFWWAGFKILAAVESDSDAAATHHANFAGAGEPEQKHHRDILELDPEDLLEDELKGKRPSVLVGGPPCQAFARIGRAKLREVAGANGSSTATRAHLDDPRASLSLRYLAYVRALKPKALLLENVPDILNHGGNNVAESICAELDDLGYEARYTLLNAINFGVPQFRERMFLVAYRRDAGLVIPHKDDWWPAHTYAAKLPKGYRGTRGVASKIAESSPHFDRPPIKDEDQLPWDSRTQDLPEAITAQAAFSGLPRLDARTRGRGRRDLRPTADDPDWTAASSEYGQKMRALSTPVDGEAERVTAHVTRHLPRDFEIFGLMSPGQDFVGNRSGQNSLSVPAIARSLDRVVPYDESKFPNKWWKMRSNHPSRTLTAHMGKDTYSHIHYSQARTISVREAARLQSFPDSFRFECSMNSGFRMIGNAVPPLMAQALASKILTVLKSGRRRKQATKRKPSRTTTSSA